MDQAVKSHLEGIKFGGVQRHRNVAVYPIFSAVDGSPNYLTMKEAMAGGFLSVTEVSAGGAVPELKVDQQRLRGRADPGRGGAGRGQAEPDRQHVDFAPAPVSQALTAGDNSQVFS